MTFLSTLSLRRATPFQGIPRQLAEISIHALLAESDFKFFPCSTHNSYFYPRSPCGERRGKPAQPQHCTHHFYPRSPCGERLQRQIEFERYSDISIHALLAESDKDLKYKPDQTVLFLSTLSLRRATLKQFVVGDVMGISIHALLAESDGRITSKGTKKFNFYPRSPCGERPTVLTLICEVIAISIHALLAESDCKPCRTKHSTNPFLSTLSLRRATNIIVEKEIHTNISIHALLAESDSKSAQNSGALLRI